MEEKEPKKRKEFKKPMTVFDAGIVPTFVDENGYETVYMRDLSGRMTTRRVHELVAEAFVQNPDGKKYVIHKDGNKLNNEADNLEWSDTPEI